MKKHTRNKLSLNLETVKSLTDAKLGNVVGGGHAHPTTTVLPTIDRAC